MNQELSDTAPQPRGRVPRDDPEWWGAECLSGPTPTKGTEIVWATTNARLSRAGLDELTGRLRAEFIGRGVRPGSTVALQLRPSFTLLACLPALWSIGAQVMLLDIRSRPAETERLLGRCEPQFHVRSTAAAGPVTAFEEDCVFAVAERPTGMPATSDACVVQFSSGSTGLPKTIRRSADSLLDEIARYTAIEAMPRRGDRLLLLCSPTHTWGLIGGVLYGLANGVTVVFPTGPRPGDLLRAAESFSISAMFGVPAHFDLLGTVADPPALPELRLAVSAGELMRPATWMRFTERFGCPLGHVYGMTEVGIITEDLHGEHPPPAVGRPAPGIELDVRNGEIVIRLPRSPYLVGDGIERFHDGWLRTFDRGEVDARTGIVSLRGRADSVVSVGGLKVDLMEVEGVLLDHEQVDEAVVTCGDVIEAYIAGGPDLDTEELLRWCRTRLSDFKLPKRFHLVARLPRSVTGKLIRDRERIRAAVPVGDRPGVTPYRGGFQ